MVEEDHRVSGKSNIMMTALAKAHRSDVPIVTYDIEAGGVFFDLKTHKYWGAPKVRHLTKLRRDYDTKRWWKRFFG